MQYIILDQKIYKLYDQKLRLFHPLLNWNFHESKVYPNRMSSFVDDCSRQKFGLLSIFFKLIVGSNYIPLKDQRRESCL